MHTTQTSWRALVCGTAIGLACCSSEVDAGKPTLITHTNIQQSYTSNAARNIGSCLALIDAGVAAPKRLLVGAAGSNNPAGSTRVGRTVPIGFDSLGNWDPILTGVTGSPTGDVGTGYYGYRCAADGTRHVVSQLGFPRVHVYQDGVLEQTLIPALVSAGSNLAPDAAVAISGDLIALGAPHDNAGMGRVHIWQRSGTTWSLDQILGGSGGQFGWSVSLHGDLLVVGAPSEGSGQAYVFERVNGSFQQRSPLPLPATLDPGFLARLGHSVGLDSAAGAALVVGAPSAKLTTLSARTGTAILYRYSPAAASRFVLLGTMPAFDPDTQSAFGSTVAIRGSNVLVADPSNQTGATPGAVYRFRGNAGFTQFFEFEKFHRTASGPGNFGWSLAFVGDGIAIGAPDSFVANPAFGSAYFMQGNQLLVDGFEQR